MTLVAEVHKLDDEFDVQRQARLIVGPERSIRVVELQPGGAALARVLLDEAIVDPFGRTVTKDDGADFVKALRWARSTDYLWVTPLFDLPAPVAADPATDLPEFDAPHVPATIPYPVPPAELAGIRVAEVRCPRSDDYTRTEVVARLVAGRDGVVTVEGPDPTAVQTLERLLAGMGHPAFDDLDNAMLAPGLFVVPAPFDTPGDQPWRDAVVGTRNAALAAGDQRSVARLDLEYLTRLPRVWLSRCPFTGEVLRMAIDAWGFDGPFWDPVAPVRPLDDLPATFVGLAGAIVDEPDNAHDSRSGGQPPPEARGPGRAPVFPTVIDDPAVRAVLSATSVGGRRCDVVAYFAGSGPTGPPQFSEWGTRCSRTRDGSRWRFVPGPPAEPPVAAEPGPWLLSGRLAWILPFDMGVELRSGADGCPWINPVPEPA